MKLLGFIFSILLLCSFLILPYPAFPETDTSVTKVFVEEGKVICFDLTKDAASKVDIGETAVGKFLQRIDTETCKVEVKKQIASCHIPVEYRDQIGERLQYGVYVLLLKNIREKTEWDIIAVGTVVGEGYEYFNGEAKQTELESAISSVSLPKQPAVMVVNKDEPSIGSGEGSGTPPSSPPPPEIIPAEPQPPPSGYAGPIYYVDPVNGSNEYGDGSEGNPWYTITYALTQVTGSTIHLEPGTYSVFTNGETFPLGMESGVNIEGEGSTCIINGANTSGVNTYHLIVIDSVSGITLSNFSIINGKGSPFGSVSVGGGIRVTNSSSITLSSLGFQNNTATAEGVTPAIGGAVYVNSDSSATINDSTFYSNNVAGNIVGTKGGAIGGPGTITISNCSFHNNSSGRDGGAIGVSYFDSTISVIRVTSCTFADNSADRFGGAIDTSGTAIIRMSVFRRNSAGAGLKGGTISFTSPEDTAGSSKIANCLFYDNLAPDCINLESGKNLDIVNTTFTGNVSTITIHFSLGGSGGSINIKNSIIVNTTGIAVDASGSGETVSFSTNAFNGNTGGNYRNSGGVFSTPPGSITDAPNFSTNYHLKLNNPTYIHQGTALTQDEINSSFNIDLDGIAFSNTTTPTLGCYQTTVSIADPKITGRVYDSVTGENISSPVVAIYRASDNRQIAVTTSNPYEFTLSTGSYFFAVAKDGYGFPSQIVSNTTSGDHGDIFTVGSDPLTINIPMDSDGWLFVEKTCNKERVEIGDIVTYRIKVQNKHWYKSVENVELVDELVNGFKYVSIPSFNLGTVSANSTQTITYQVRVGSAVPPGRYKTSAYTRKSTTLSRNSNIDTTEIEVIETPLFTRGTIIGKVFWDENGNGMQDRGESGISKVKIYTEYGVEVETDEVGKYHISDVPAGNHLLKVDTTGFPAYIRFTTDNPYYVKITEGLLAKVNFGITPLTPPSPIKIGEGKGEGQFFIVALGEGIVRNLDTSGNIEMVEKDDRYDDGLNVDGRLALFLKGKILGKYLIKASIDTDRRAGKRGDRRSLFTNLDPDKYYPVYGDASKVDYSGVDTQDVVYVIIEWDESLAKWGSFHTEMPLYNRTLSGGIINYQSVGKTKFDETRTKIKGFGAFSRQKPAHDEFVGTGGSLYYLRHRDIIEGTEKLKVEVRDRIGKIVTNSIPLLEEKDYEIDYDTGRILLKRPLNSIQQGYNNSIISNDILMGERVYLVVDYEYYGGGLSDQAWGINASQWLGNHIRIGGTYVEEQKEGDPYKLMGGDGTVKINKDTEVNVNYSRTEETQLGSTMSYDGGLTFSEQGSSYSLNKSGNAVSVDGKTKLFNNTDIFLSYSRQDPYYSVTNSISSQGSQKYLGNIITKLTENLSIGLAHLTQKYYEGSIAGETFGATDSHTTTGILDWRPGKWDLRGEYQHQEVKNPITSYTYFGTLPLLDNDFIAARIGYELFNWLHPYIRGQVTVNGEANDQGTVGADINIGRDTTINLAETVGTLGDSTLVGLTTKITETTDVYANLEVGNHTRLGKYSKTTYGQSTQLDPTSKAYVETDYSSYRENVVRGNVLGYRKKITDTLGLGLTYERSNVKNNTTAIDRDTGAISLTYLNPDWLKAFTKLELRNDRGTNEIRQWVTQNDILYKPIQWLELSGRCNWGWTEDQDTENREAEFYEVGAGFSLRPVTWDRLNLIGKYSYITDYPPDSQWDFLLDIESIKNVYSIEGIYDLFKYLSLVGKFSYRDMTEKVGTFDWVDSDTYLYIARTNFHILNSEPNKPFFLRGWDFAVEYRILANDQIEDEKEGFLVELDKDLGNYIRCGIGYNFTDYDDDLRNDDDWDAKGWFFKLAGKY